MTSYQLLIHNELHFLHCYAGAYMTTAVSQVLGTLQLYSLEELGATQTQNQNLSNGQFNQIWSNKNVVVVLRCVETESDVHVCSIRKVRCLVNSRRFLSVLCKTPMFWVKLGTHILQNVHPRCSGINIGLFE